MSGTHKIADAGSLVEPHEVKRSDLLLENVAKRWVPLAGIVLLMAVAVRLTAQPISDPDTWWHLRVGSLLWAGSITVFDTTPLSAFATEEWIPRDWIPQLLASKFEDWFGLPGVAWLHGAAFILLIGTCFLVCRQQASPLPSLIATFLGILAAHGSLTPRPQMVSFVLLSVFVGAWLKTARDLRPRWWLVPLAWLWANSHGMWYLSAAVGAAVVMGIALDRSAPRSTVLRLSLIPVLCVAVAGLTPGGPRQIIAAFTTADKWGFVTEWAPTNFATPSPIAAVVMACGVILAAARRPVRTSWVVLGLFFVGFFLLLMSARTVAPGAIVLAPVLAMALHDSLTEDPPPKVRWHEFGALLGGVLLCTTWLAFLVPHTSKEPAQVPSALDRQLGALAPGSAILNDYGLGGWLHWKHPGLNTVIDGFTDGYTVQAVNEYVSARRVEPGWQAYVEQSGSHVALLEEDSPLAAALVDQLGWWEIGSDKGYVLLTKPE